MLFRISTNKECSKSPMSKEHKKSTAEAMLICPLKLKALYLGKYGIIVRT